MKIPETQPGVVIAVRPLADTKLASISNTLNKTPNVEVIRKVLPVGKVLSEHKSPGESIGERLGGGIAFATIGSPKKLQEGGMLFLATGEAHAFEALEDSSFLLKIMRPEASQ